RGDPRASTACPTRAEEQASLPAGQFTRGREIVGELDVGRRHAKPVDQVGAAGSAWGSRSSSPPPPKDVRLPPRCTTTSFVGGVDGGRLGGDGRACDPSLAGGSYATDLAPAGRRRRDPAAAPVARADRGRDTTMSA